MIGKLNEIAAKFPLEKVVGKTVPLTAAGAGKLGRCPQCGARIATLFVSGAENRFTCFACADSGDGYSFIARRNGISFADAVKLFAKKAQVDIVPDDARLAPWYGLYELAHRFYQAEMQRQPEGAKVAAYVRSRGLDAELLRRFSVGYAPDGWDMLLKRFQAAGIPAEVTVESGLGCAREGKSPIDMFRNRLVFAIRDPFGRVIGFGGRVMDDSLPKYINPRETQVYRKSEALYGVDEAYWLFEEKGAVVSEGYTDRIALARAGILWSVATCGTALTDYHAGIISSRTSNVTLLFDADSAGFNACWSAMDKFLPLGIHPRACFLPPGDDPDSYLREHGPQALAAKVAEARPVVPLFIKECLDATNLKKARDVEKGVLEPVVPRLRLLPEQVRVEIACKLADRLKMDRSVLIERVSINPEEL